MVNLRIEDVERFLANVTQENIFWIHKGPAVENLEELKDSLTKMPKEVYEHHVTKEKNDFAHWIKDCIGDAELYHWTLKSRNKNDMHKKIAKRIYQLKKLMKVYEKRKKKEERKVVGKFSEKEKMKPEPKQENYVAKKGDREDIKKKLEEILLKEKEIEIREQKIQEIEEKIEKGLIEGKEPKFFSREFVQGIAVGVLACLIIILIYTRFFAG